MKAGHAVKILTDLERIIPENGVQECAEENAESHADLHAVQPIDGSG